MHHGTSVGSGLRNGGMCLRCSRSSSTVVCIGNIGIISANGSTGGRVLTGLPRRTITTLGRKRGLVTVCYGGHITGNLVSYNLLMRGSGARGFARATMRGSMSIRTVRAGCRFAYKPISLGLTFASPLFVSGLSLVAHPIDCLACRITSGSKGGRGMRLCFRTKPR